MRLSIARLGRIEIPRNDVLGGYKQAYINTMIQTTRFKNRFLQYWDGVGEFSMFNDPDREAMTKLLGMHNQFDGQTDLKQTEMDDGLKDVLLRWTIKPEGASEALKDDVMLNIKRDVLDVLGYTVKYTATNEPMLVNGVELTDDIEIAIYSQIIRLIANGMGTYTFTWTQIETQLRSAIFNGSGIPMLASYGVASVSYGTSGIMLTWHPASSSLQVDATKLQALAPDEFMQFVNSYLDFRYVEDDKEWWEKLLEIVLVIITIYLVIVSVGALGAAFNAATAAASMTGATLTTVTTAAVGALASYGITTTAFGITAGLLIGAANIYGAMVSLTMLGGVQMAEDTVSSPAEIENKVSMADEMRWTYNDSDKPESQILQRLNEGLPE